MGDFRQLSFSDCFITLNELRAQYGLTELFSRLGDVIIPVSEMETKKEECRYWQYYNASCKAGRIPKSFEEWKKEVCRI